jgi:hypothetical protein
MPTERRFNQSSTLEYRLAQEAFNLREQAQGMPDGIRRDELLRKADQMDVAAHLNGWLSSPGLRART